MRGGQAPARLLRAARARPAGRRSSEAVAAAREHGLLVIADGKRGDVPVTAARLRAGAGGRDARARSARSRARRRRLHRQPAARPRLARAAGRGRRARPAPAASCSCAPPTRAPPTLQDRRGDAAAARAARAAGRRARRRRSRRLRPVAASGAVTGATRPELLGAPARADAARDLPAPRRGRPGRQRRRTSARRSRPHPAAGLVTASRSIVNAHAERGRRPGACGGRAAAEELRAAAWDV